MAVDYRDFGKGSKGVTGAWWRAKDVDVADAVTQSVDAIRDRQRYRTEANLVHARLYGGMQTLGFAPTQYSRELATSSLTPKKKLRSRPQLNLVKSMVDTVVSKVGKSKPRATFLTSGGTFASQQRAKRLNRLSQGQFHEANVYAKSPRVLTDACVLGTGIFKAYIANWKVCVERVFVEELLVDDSEGMYGAPRSMFQTKPIAREVLKGDPAYQSKAQQKAIDSGRKPNPGRGSSITALKTGEGDMVEVMEAWHLASEDGKGGRHVICTNAGVLLDEEWDWDVFPIVAERYAHRLLGWYGEGIPERHLGRQESINRTLIRIDDILHLCAVPRYLVPDGSNVAVEQIRNAIGDILKYRGAQAPVLAAPPPLTPELMNYLARLVSEGYELEGISQLSAGARKPAGLNSGEAIRTYGDVEDQRFVILGQEHEDVHLQLAKLMLRMGAKCARLAQEAKDAGEDVPEYAVRYAEKRGYEDISWKDAFPEGEVDWDSFVVQMFPTSSLPTTPSARKQAVEEMWQAGWIDAQEARRLLDFPDLEASNNVAFAAWEDIEQAVEDILEKGEYRPPEPYQDLKAGIQRMQSGYLRARRLNAPEARLELMRRWMSQADETLKKALPPPAPPPMPPMGAAPGLVPGAMPPGAPVGLPPPAAPPIA